MTWGNLRTMNTGMTDIRTYILQLGQEARAASRVIGAASTATKSAALLAMADTLDRSREVLKAANALDMEAAGKNGIDQPLIDRLGLDDRVIDRMIEGLHQVDKLPDPVGEVTDLVYRPSGIQVGRMRVPLGVIGIIYESRPNVTVEAASLCLKSGNACILRGGSEAFHSNQAISGCIARGVERRRIARCRGTSAEHHRSGRGRGACHARRICRCDRSPRRQRTHRAYQPGVFHSCHQASGRGLSRVY